MRMMVVVVVCMITNVHPYGVMLITPMMTIAMAS